MAATHEAILDLLAACPGGFVSGEVISQTLGLTRAAVWKQITALRAAGYVIDAQTKSGYRLAGLPLDLDAWALRKELKTDCLGRELYVFDELGSTNDWAKERARAGVGHGLAVLARRQTSGRGRLQREWMSPRGGLWLSIVLALDWPLSEAAKLTLGASVAVAQAIEEVSGVRTLIKWPNDLLLNGRKVAGILGEVAGEWATFQTMVLGIGINANLPSGSLDPALPAVSLSEVVGRKVNLNSLAARVLEHVESEVKMLGLAGFGQLKERWLQRAAGLGQEVKVFAGGEERQGVFLGITDEGSLLVRSAAGDQIFAAGEVTLRKGCGYFTPEG